MTKSSNLDGQEHSYTNMSNPMITPPTPVCRTKNPHNIPKIQIEDIALKLNKFSDEVCEYKSESDGENLETSDCQEQIINEDEDAPNQADTILEKESEESSELSIPPSEFSITEDDSEAPSGIDEEEVIVHSRF